MATRAMHTVKGLLCAPMSFKNTTEHKHWDVDKKKKPKNPRNIIDGDNNAAVLFTGAYCARHAGAQKNNCSHELKDMKT